MLTLRTRSLFVFALAALSASCTSVTVERIAELDPTGIHRIEKSVTISSAQGLEVEDSFFRMADDFATDDARVIRESIETAIQSYGPFREVVKSGGDYQVEATLQRLMQKPASGLSIACSAVIDWRCVEASSGKVVYEKRVATDDSKSVGDAVAGAVRQVLAHEGAVKENIRVALVEISAALGGAQ